MNEVKYPKNEVAEIAISMFHTVIEKEQRKVLEAQLQQVLKDNGLSGVVYFRSTNDILLDFYLSV